MAEADSATASYGLESLATLPVFLKLENRPVVMAGGSLPAVWKTELLAATGANVRVLAEVPCAEMVALVGRLGVGRVTLLGRRWSPDDLAGAALAIGAMEDTEEAGVFRAAARAIGVPVNVIDKPDYCDFQFGTIVARSPVLIGISTHGAAPVFAQALRARIEAVLPQNLRGWAEAARLWRPRIQARGLDFRRRRQFWEAFSRRALSGAGDPTPDDLEACLAAADDVSGRARGRVVLVGCGGGEQDSATLAAVAALQSADVLIYDADVTSSAVGLARREAQRFEAAATTPDVVADMARDKVVVWLGSGSPFVCERWNERRIALEERSAALEVVPGLPVCPICPAGCRFRAA